MTRMESPQSAAIEAEPSFGGFKTGFDAGIPQLVWTRLVADLETPVSAMLKLSRG